MARAPMYTKSIGKFICDKVEEGITVKEIAERFTEFGVPNEKNIYRWKKKYPEFKHDLDLAYQNFFYQKIDEIERLSKEALALQDNGQSCPEDFKGANAWKAGKTIRLNSIRVRIDTLKFMLSKLAPKLCADLKEDHKGPATVILPNITITNYHQPSTQEINDINSLPNAILDGKLESNR